jgi:hypothetical protein
MGLARTLAIVLTICCTAVTLVGCAGDFAHLTLSMRRKSNFAIQPGQRVAVLTFTGSHGAAVTDLISIELMRKGIDVLDRDMLDRVVGELRRAEDGSYVEDMTEEDILSRIGQIAGADVIVFGQVGAVDPRVAPRAGIAKGRFRMQRKDYGDQSPVFAAAASSVSVRVFSATSGEVMCWGTAETAMHASKGDHLRLMDYLRFSAKNAAWGMTDPSVQMDERLFANQRIPR